MADGIAVNDPTPEFNASLGERVLESLLRAYDRYANRQSMPTNRRVFLETVLDRSRQPITEQSFRPEEVAYIRNMVMRPYQMNAGIYKQYGDWLQQRLERDKSAKKDSKLYPEFRQSAEKQLSAIREFEKGRLTQDFIDVAAGKEYFFDDAVGALKQTPEYANFRNAFQIRPAVTYENYAMDPELRSGDPGRDRFASAGATPRQAVHLTLGQFGYRVDPATGNLVAYDTYDFNPPINPLTGRPEPQAPLGLYPVAENTASSPELGTTGLYNMLRQYAGRKVPPGQGRPVNINLGGGLESTAVPYVPPQMRR
jgi:hypothetical protein